MSIGSFARRLFVNDRIQDALLLIKWLSGGKGEEETFLVWANFEAKAVQAIDASCDVREGSSGMKIGDGIKSYFVYTKFYK